MATQFLTISNQITKITIKISFKINNNSNNKINNNLNNNSSSFSMKTWNLSKIISNNNNKILININTKIIICFPIKIMGQAISTIINKKKKKINQIKKNNK